MINFKLIDNSKYIQYITPRSTSLKAVLENNYLNEPFIKKKAKIPTKPLMQYGILQYKQLNQYIHIKYGYAFWFLFLKIFFTPIRWVLNFVSVFLCYYLHFL